MQQTVEGYLATHEQKGLLRFMTCGSVDDGKSTLIGRLLYDSKMIYEDQLASLEKDSKTQGTARQDIDLALLVDGLQSEREQGITIDVAYRFFSTNQRKFIIVDAPGHEQYTRNMVTGASNVDAAIVLIDAEKGVQTQTKRHSFILSLLGVSRIIVAVNKMDLVDYDEGRFKRIKQTYEEVAEKLNLQEITFIPMSALKGDNVVDTSTQMPWYQGKSLLDCLNDLPLPQLQQRAFRFPVQYVNRPNAQFRGYAGTIASGEVKIGDEIVLYPSKQATTIKGIYQPAINQDDALVETAKAPAAVTIFLTDELDVSRGDMLVGKQAEPVLTTQCMAQVIWMSETPLSKTASYWIKSSSQTVSGCFSEIADCIDVNSFETYAANEIGLNAIVNTTLLLEQPLMVDIYAENKITGGFIVIDKYSHETIAAGIVTTATRTHDNMVKRTYTPFELELNALIRKHYPGWGCATIR